MVKIVTFGTLKGGVGKTIICFNIAGVLAELGKNVLVIDCDLQGNITNNMGIDRTKHMDRTAYDIFNVVNQKLDIEQLIVKSPIPLLPSLDVIPGSIFLHKAEFKITAIAGREQILKNYLEDNQDLLNHYDYVLIDTNPSMSIVNQNAFIASDSIVLVSDVSMNSLDGSLLFMALWDDIRKRMRKENNITGFIINDYERRNKLSSDYMEYIKTDEEMEDIRQILLDTIIPRNIKMTESELAGIPINIYDPNSKGSDAMKKLVAEMIDKKIL